jgi:hypothetical protein
VVLLRADDKSGVRSFNIASDANEGQFNFRFVTDGEYILRVKDPADAVDELKQEAGLVYRDYKQVRHYASVDLPISFHSDLTNLVISVPDEPTATSQKQ